MTWFDLVAVCVAAGLCLVKATGHLGAATVSTKGHRVMAINEQDNTLAVGGPPTPGANKSFVFIRHEKMVWL